MLINSFPIDPAAAATVIDTTCKKNFDYHNTENKNTRIMMCELHVNANQRIK
jgi:hypothetical protein